MKHWVTALLVVLLVGAGVLLSGCGIQQQKQRSGLQVESGNGQAVAVYLDGTFINNTPMIDRKLRPGKHTLRLEPTDTNLVPFERIIELHEGTITWVVWNPGPSEDTSGGTILEVATMTNKRQWWQFNTAPSPDAESRLSFESHPDNAIVSIDNEPQVRFTPSDYVDYGEKPINFTVTLPSYETQAHSINLQPGYQVKIISKLAKKDALLTESVATTSAVLGSNDEKNTPKPTIDTNDSRIVAGTSIMIKPTQFRVNGEEVLRVREKADARSAVVDHALVGQSYPFLGERSGDWVKIKTATASGWVSSTFTEELQAPAQ